MKHASRIAAALLAAAALSVWTIPSHAADATTQPSSDVQGATGTITGTVTKDGKPLANARVGLVDASQIVKHRKQAQDQTTTNADAQPEKHQRPTPAATTMTDSDGKFTLDDVKPGEYVVIANLKGEGRGRSKINLSAGQTATLEISVMPKNQDGAPRAHHGKANKADKNNPA